jgi:hypothetical protein
MLVGDDALDAYGFGLLNVGLDVLAARMAFDEILILWAGLGRGEKRAITFFDAIGAASKFVSCRQDEK